MFLRSNARAAGLVYKGKPLQAQYVAAFENDHIVAVAAHCWNNVLLVRAVLFAERDDAKRAYASIGFRIVGEYGLVLFGGK